MTYEQQYLIHLLSSSIKLTVPNPPEKELSWTELQKIAREQKILPLLYESLCRLDEKYQPSEEIMKVWEKESLSCAYFFALQAEQIYNVLKAAEENGTDMIVLKGMILRELYPVPELRTMSDCDVIIKKEQLDKVKEVFTSLGYKIERELETTIEFVKEGALKFEAFYSVFSGLKAQEGFNKDMWTDSQPLIGNHVVQPSVNDNFVHTVAHHAKHIRSRGAGLRNLADIVLLAEKTEIDWKYVIEQFKLLNIEKLFYGIMRSAEKYFDYKIAFDCPPIDDEKIDVLMEFMASNGIYGVMDNLFIFDARFAKGKRLKRIKNYLIKIFPTRKKLTNRYQYAKKSVLLLPVAWFHRLFRVVFIERFSVSHQIHSMKTAGKRAESQIEILEYFNIN